MAAILSAVSSSQTMRPAERDPVRATSSTRSGVTIRSMGTSWSVTGSAPAGSTCTSWTVVTTRVSSPIIPASDAMANSRSANPHPCRAAGRPR
jgi:hypothetical protein